jgi:hypothetical protein
LDLLWGWLSWVAAGILDYQKAFVAYRIGFEEGWNSTRGRIGDPAWLVTSTHPLEQSVSLSAQSPRHWPPRHDIPGAQATPALLTPFSPQPVVAPQWVSSAFGSMQLVPQ